MQSALRLLWIVGVLAWPGLSHGDVLSSSELGFTSENAVHVSVPPEKAYRRMIDRVDQWWDAAHTFGGDAARLSMTDRVGECFCERLPTGGEVRSPGECCA
jgi:hypothetical protein